MPLVAKDVGDYYWRLITRREVVARVADAVATALCDCHDADGSRLPPASHLYDSRHYLFSDTPAVLWLSAVVKKSCREAAA